MGWKMVPPYWEPIIKQNLFASKVIKFYCCPRKLFFERGRKIELAPIEGVSPYQLFCFCHKPKRPCAKAVILADGRAIVRYIKMKEHWKSIKKGIKKFAGLE